MDTTQVKQTPKGLEIRYTEPQDAKYLHSWLMDPSARELFPMADEIEIDDAVARWIAFYRFKCSLTLLKEGVPCGIATLYLQPYRRLSHQCEFGIIVGPSYRNEGVGSYLMSSLMHLAKETFKIELIHLQVRAGNRAIKFYERFGFKEFGRQNFWLREQNDTGEKKYDGRVFMERMI